MDSIKIKTNTTRIEIAHPLGVTVRENVLIVGSYSPLYSHHQDETKIFKFFDAFTAREAYEKVDSALKHNVDFVDISDLCERPATSVV